MKNLLCFAFFSFLIPVLCFSQSSSLLKTYKIPTYSYHSICINSPSLLDFSRINYLGDRGSDELFNMNLNFVESYMAQSPKKTSMGKGILSFNYASETHRYHQGYNFNTNGLEEQKTTNDHFTYTGVFTGQTDRYFADEKGLFFNLGLNLFQIFLDKPDIFLTFNNAPIGLGYGRVIGVKNVVQAYIISDELGLSLNDDSLLKLAEIIEKYKNGFYLSKFRDDSEIHFYNDIAEIIGEEGHEAKIDQILNSPIYKTSTRYIGWDFRFGFNNTYVTEDYLDLISSSKYVLDFFASIKYALPIDLNKQFIASAKYSYNLTNDDPNRTPKLGLSSSFTIDHNYKWSSSLSANYRMAFFEGFEGYDKLANTRISLKSDYLLSNRFSIFASLSYKKEGFLDNVFPDNEDVDIEEDNIDNTMINSLLSPYSFPNDQKMEYIDFRIGLNVYVK